MSFNGTFTNSSSSLECLPTFSSLPWYLIAVVSVISLLGIPSNITVIGKLSWHLRGSNISQRLFFILAVSDLLCLLCLPIGLVVLHNGSPQVYVVCQLLVYIFFFCISADLNILVLIGLQRYFQIVRPDQWAKLSRNWQRLLLCSVWMLASLEALPVVFSLKHNDNKSIPLCCGYRIAAAFEAAYIAFFVFGHLVLLSCYLLLVRRLNQTKMARKKLPRATKLFVRIIAVSLAVSFFPLIVRMLYVAALYIEDSDKLLEVSKKLTVVECFYFFNHCLNPFLYFFASRHEKTDKRRSHVLND
ncbi:P2Y purinoceptor 8-like [Echeneis naucrates]|uniref:P2Y purinoceptor 8-like n=1 Tax=Echeneis naucrates TaxID=173247 RepID=A0A665TNP1_ECHNA|nr:P2Y purinoceptor 8-like [Echeneis naucrates]